MKTTGAHHRPLSEEGEDLDVEFEEAVELVVRWSRRRAAWHPPSESGDDIPVLRRDVSSIH